MTTPPNPEEAIVDAALEMPAHERAAYLEKECGNDRQLRQLVDALLHAHKKIISSQILPPRDPSPPLLEETTPERRAAGMTTKGLSVTPIEKPGDHIGRYKLLQQIGEGGGGIVYMAEQVEPVRRRVALKVIKLGMDTRQVIARFEAERQALALMDHPNIAKVHDAGATETGRPYFVMELVRGIKITDYCDQNHLPTEKRLDLFIQTCKAIQHAHQKGVIHRDIKPSNILVTLHDGLPVPKVIDFGIAKATTGQPLTDKTVFTAFEQFIGTPAYMSPEQAEMSGLDIDTRSDIYSLGVLLYELLTGQMPFDPRELAASGFEEMRRIIRTEDPLRPSTRLSNLNAADQTTAAKCRQVEATKLIHLVRGDLDWIVMKCLEKDRSRRYDTANGAANDIERHLKNEPVVARPPSQLYRFQKSFQRNRLAFGAATAVALALVIGLVVAMAMFFRAQAEKKKAQTEAAKSQQVAQFLQEMLKGVDPDVALGRDTSVLKEILDKTAERLGKELKNQPDVEAALRTTIGEVYNALGEFEKAEAMHRRALAISRKRAGGQNVDAANSLYNLAVVLRHESKLAEAEAAHREALAIRRKLLGQEHPDVAASLSSLSDVLRFQERRVEAEAMSREALMMRRKLLGNESREVAESLNQVANVLHWYGKAGEAEQLYRESLEIWRRIAGNEHPSVAGGLDNLARALQGQRKYSEAEVTCREALAMYRKLLGNEHPRVAYCLEELAEMLRLQGKRVEMEAPLRESLAIYETRLPDSWWGFSIRSELGGVLFEQEKYTEAEPLLLSGYEGMIQREDKIPDRYKGHVRRALQRLVKLYEATNRPNQSAEWKQKLEEFEHAEARKRAPAAIQTPVTKPLPGPPVPATTALLDARDGQDLLQKIGQTVTVKGEIVAFGTSTSRTFHYLNFLDQNYSGALTLAFRIADNPVEFREELLRGYLNKTVVVQGMISEHRGGPQFLMKSLAQIQIWDEGRQPKGTNEAPK